YGMEGYVEIGLVVIVVSWGKPGADISDGVSVPRRGCGQSSEIEVVRPASRGRGRQFGPNHLSLDRADQKCGIAEPCRKLGQRIAQAGRAIGRALGDGVRGHLVG